jgi:hypothetical protein
MKNKYNHLWFVIDLKRFLQDRRGALMVCLVTMHRVVLTKLKMWQVYDTQKHRRKADTFLSEKLRWDNDIQIKNVRLI